MTSFGRIAREPLLHFLLIGAAIFVLAARIDGDQSNTPRDRIVLTEGRLQQLVQIFARTWQRPPTAQEVRGMIEVHVKEEIYYREALKRGLDRNDTAIRRRMRQKMEFLTEPSDEVLKASDAELKAYLATNRSEFRVEPRVAFQQIFINPKKSEEPPAARAEKLKAKLNTAGFKDSPAARLHSLGDPTLLPRALPKMPLTMIDRRFGRGFGKQLAKLPLNEWHGPIRSPFGLHLVRVTERREGYDPPLAEVRAAVERRWRAAKREAYKQAEYRRLREKYEVVLPDLGDRRQKAKKAP